MGGEAVGNSGVATGLGRAAVGVGRRDFGGEAGCFSVSEGFSAPVDEAFGAAVRFGSEADGGPCGAESQVVGSDPAAAGEAFAPATSVEAGVFRGAADTAGPCGKAALETLCGLGLDGGASWLGCFKGEVGFRRVVARAGADGFDRAAGSLRGRLRAEGFLLIRRWRVGRCLSR